MAVNTNRAVVFYNNKKAGLLIRTEDGYEFEYDHDYVNSPGAKPISKALPLSQKRFFSEKLFPFFENLLPEGIMLEMTVSKLKIDKNNKFELLLHVGGDTVGAVTVKPLHKF